MTEFKIDLNESLLLQQLANSDQSAFDQLFKSYYKYLVSIAYHYINEENRAKDIVQDVYLDLWNRREKINIQQSIKYFLRRAVINSSLAAKRKTNRLVVDTEKTEAISGSVETTRDTLAFNELNEVVKSIISSLPERCQQVFVLSRVENLSHKEIAEKLNISTKTIENQISKALKTIRIGLKERGLLTFFGIFLNFL